MIIFLSILGIIVSFFMVTKREMVGDWFGDADWMSSVGGIYNVIVIVAIFIFFWSLATLTGTTDLLFGWIRYILPGSLNAPPPADIIGGS